MKSEPVSESKDGAIRCLKSVVRGIAFPSPTYGIVFLRFQSDIEPDNRESIASEELSRNSVSYMPYMPRKLINATVEMYMPYYKGCFKKPYVEKIASGSKYELHWNIGEDGRATDIEVVAPENSEKFVECMARITEQHRYPSGYLKTPYEN